MAYSERTVFFPYNSQAVWDVVADFDNAAWRGDIVRTEAAGPGRFVEYTAGGIRTTFFIRESVAPSTLALDLENVNLTGSSTLELRPAPGGTTVQMCEQVKAKKWFLTPVVSLYLKRQQAAYAAALERELKRRAQR